MTSKYDILYTKLKRKQREITQISRVLPKEEKLKGSRFDRYRNEIQSLLREVEEVRVEIASQK